MTRSFNMFGALELEVDAAEPGEVADRQALR
jgi:hypothetical protein